MVVGYAGLLDLGYVAFYAIGAYTAAWLASPHFAGYGISFALGRFVASWEKAARLISGWGVPSGSIPTTEQTEWTSTLTPASPVAGGDVQRKRPFHRKTNASSSSAIIGFGAVDRT